MYINQQDRRANTSPTGHYELAARV
ncbi:hypothetical protein DSUL_50206 [Desulfovibrionales bacterium]